jgi:hypothetical protein
MRGYAQKNFLTNIKIIKNGFASAIEKILKAYKKYPIYKIR